MSERRPQSLAQIMAGSQRLRALDQARQTRADWTRRAQSWVPADISPHLVAATLSDAGILMLSFDSAAWAARSRYLGRQIMAAAGDPDIKSVKVRVHPQGGQPSDGSVGGNK